MYPPTTAKRPERRELVPVLVAGLTLTLVALASAVVDQTSTQTIARHVNSMYAPFNEHPDPNVLLIFLYAMGALGVLFWLAALWGIKRHRQWTSAIAGVVFVFATPAALVVLVASEHGTRIFPPTWGILSILPCIAGLVALALMWIPRGNVR